MGALFSTDCFKHKHSLDYIDDADLYEPPEPLTQSFMFSANRASELMNDAEYKLRPVPPQATGST